MPRGRPRSSGSNLESRIQEFAQRFARDIIAALSSAPLSDIARLSGNGARAAALATGTASAAAAGPGRRGAKGKRKMLNYPKCHWPGCNKNMSPRTRPWCGEHNRRVQSGEAAPAGAGPKNSASSAAAAKKPRARKKAARGGRGRRAAA